MLELVISKAVELFNTEEFDDDNQLLSAVYAWDWALDLAILTDEDALKLMTDILGDPELKSKITYWQGDDNEFCGLIRSVLFGKEGFGQMVADRIENYEEIYAERKARAEDRASNL